MHRAIRAHMGRFRVLMILETFFAVERIALVQLEGRRFFSTDLLIKNIISFGAGYTK